MIQARRLRLDAVATACGRDVGVIVIGALIGVSSSFFFKVNEPPARHPGPAARDLHRADHLHGLRARRPFRGDLGLGSNRTS